MSDTLIICTEELGTNSGLWRIGLPGCLIFRNVGLTSVTMNTIVFYHWQLIQLICPIITFVGTGMR
jgi:hypothetical protein